MNEENIDPVKINLDDTSTELVTPTTSSKPPILNEEMGQQSSLPEADPAPVMLESDDEKNASTMKPLANQSAPLADQPPVPETTESVLSEENLSQEGENISKPLPAIGIRTMQTDMSALQSGKFKPGPIPVLPSEIESGRSASELESVKKFSNVYATPVVVSGWKDWLIQLVIVLILAGLLAALLGFGYYVFLPKFLQFNQSTPSTTNQVVKTIPTTQPTPKPQPVQQFIHSPLLKGRTIENDLTLFSLDIISVKGSLFDLLLQNQVSTSTESILEISWKYNNQFITADQMLSILKPDLSQNDAKNLFDKDFWTFVYNNKFGNWPLYVFKLNPGIQPATALQQFSGLEKGQPLTNFYLKDPGTFKSFSDTSIGSWKLRTAIPINGAAFTYGSLGNFVILSTSLDAVKYFAVAAGLL